MRIVLAAIGALLGLVVIFPIVLFGLPFWTFAWLTRVICRLLEPPIYHWHQLVDFDPIVGWKSKAHVDAHCLAEPAGEIFHVRTDAQGWRGKASIAESDLVVFGDSFAFGYGVHDEFCFSELNSELRIKGIGAPGYNMVQSLLWMRHLSSHLKNKLVVWLICVQNDLFDNLKPQMNNYRTPFVRQVNDTENWEIVRSHITSAKWSFYNFDLHMREHGEVMANLYSETFLSRRAYSACEFLIGEGRSLCNHAGARLVVMTIPDIFELNQRGLERLYSWSADPKTFNPDLPHLKIGEICNKLDVPLFSLKDHTDIHDYNQGDRHWNNKGHRKFNEVLSGIYQDYAKASNGLPRWGISRDRSTFALQNPLKEVRQ